MYEHIFVYIVLPLIIIITITDFNFLFKHNRLDIIILNKQQKQAYLLDIAVPNLLMSYREEVP
jgi:hypothetical protein